MKHLISAITLLACLIIPTDINSTCIVILKTSNSIYVVADTQSSLTAVSKKGEVVKAKATINKIGHAGNYYFAISGHDDQILMRCALEIDSNRSLSVNIPNYCEKMKKHYSFLMRWQKEYYPEGYKYYLKNDLASVAFFTKEKGKPTLIVIYFTMTEVKGLPQISYEVAEDLHFVTLGISDHINKLPNAESLSYNKGVNGLVELVTLEAKSHQGKIACPFDILVWESKPSITRKQCN
jgi:hypothetical protein